MKPYYEDEAAAIYHGDCREVLPDIEADVLVTDPPYGDGSQWSWLGNIVSLFGRAAVFGYPEELVRWCVEAHLFPSEWAVWNPRTPRPTAGRGLPRWSEHIAIFGPVSGGAEVLRPRAAKGREAHARLPAHKHGPSSEWARAGDVWDDPANFVGNNSHLRLHPSQKPVSVFHKLLTLCSRTEERVVDPFMGSGTTLRAAKDLGRKAIGIEIEERYCEIAARRMGQEVLVL